MKTTFRKALCAHNHQNSHSIFVNPGEPSLFAIIQGKLNSLRGIFKPGIPYGGKTNPTSSATLVLIAASLLLFITVAVLFWPATNYSITTFDDTLYTFDNQKVAGGITLKGLRDVFSSPYEAYWAPLLWISYMLDVELYGLDFRGFHLTNILLHATNAVLLFLLLFLGTKRFILSFMTAIIFAIHPLRVESVAWIAERKDVLSSFFLLGCLGAYWLWVKTSLKRWYTALAVLFIMGLMVKPVLVTLPFLLLIVDLWPMERAPFGLAKSYTESRTSRTYGSLIVEKLPMFFISIIFGVVTVITQRALPGMGHPEPLKWIPGRFFLSFLVYLKKTVWPFDLTLTFYDSALEPGILVTVSAFLAILCICIVIYRNSRQYPWVLAGWAWFLIALLPVSGIIPAGTQWVADRFTYIPHMGLLAALVWTASSLVKKLRIPGFAVFAATAFLLAGLTFLTRQQLPYWEDGITLFTRAVEHKPGSAQAVIGLGIAQTLTGQHDLIIETFEKALRMDSTSAVAHYNLATGLVKNNRFDEAISHFRAAIELEPGYYQTRLSLALALTDLRQPREAQIVLADIPFDRLTGDQKATACFIRGLSFLQQDHPAQAVSDFRAALEIRPDMQDVPYNFGLALSMVGRVDEAIEQYEESLRIYPDNLMARINVAEQLFRLGRFPEAVFHFREVIRQYPGSSEAHFAAGRIFQTRGDNVSAGSEYREGIEAQPIFPEIMDALNATMTEISEY